MEYTPVFKIILLKKFKWLQKKNISNPNIYTKLYIMIHNTKTIIHKVNRNYYYYYNILLKIETLHYIQNDKANNQWLFGYVWSESYMSECNCMKYERNQNI